MKTRICPKCKSDDVIMNIPDAFTASMAGNHGWRCNNCGFKLPEFPLKSETKKQNKKK